MADFNINGTIGQEPIAPIPDDSGQPQVMTQGISFPLRTVSGGPKAGTVPMLYQGAWEQKDYNQGDVVYDGAWTMCALTDTNERAGVFPIGDSEYFYSGTLSPFQNSSSSIVFGNRYTVTGSGGYLTGYRIDTVAGFEYRISVVVDPLTNPVVTQLIDFTANKTGWTEFSVSASILREGTQFDLIAAISEPDPTPVFFEAPYVYSTPQNQGTPSAGVVLQSNSTSGSIRISKTDDDGGDQSVGLEALSPGDTITGGTEWTILSVFDGGTFMDFGVAPSQQAGAAERSTWRFDTVTATPIDVGREVDAWVSNANAQGLFDVNGDYTAITPDDNAYGVDILLQDAYVPTDWGFVAYSDGAVGGGTGVASPSTDDVLGWGNYTDSETSPATQVITTTPQKLSIDGASVTSNTDYLPGEILGSGQLWDAVNNKITPIGLGDGYTLRIDLEVIAETSNPNELIFQLDISGNATPDIPIVERIASGGKTTPYTLSVGFPIFSLDTFIANGGQIFLSTDTGSFEVASRNISIHRISKGV